MSDQEIIDLFDSSNILVRDLAMMAGKSVEEVKEILMSA